MFQLDFICDNFGFESKIVINRHQLAFAKERLFKGKALIIYGPRQAGKTTFTELLLKETNEKILRLNGDDADTRSVLSEANSTLLQNIIGNHKILVIDEDQRIPNIGIAIKIIVDQFKDVQVIATGSSSFELANHINEPLTGRKYELLLLPIAFQEMVAHTDYLNETRMLEQRLVFGSYPEIITDPSRAEEHIKLLANSYLYKDLYLLEQIKNPILLEKLVKALALQVGSEISVNELSKLIGADNKTIEKYISALEQAFVVFTLTAFSKNVRNELKKSRKIYFYDNGVINAITGNFNAIQQRTDVGALWESYLISERLKFKAINQMNASSHFWRTTQQQEIDYIESSSTSMAAYEFKWSAKANYKFPVTFSKAYPSATLQTIHPKNYGSFLS